MNDGIRIDCEVTCIVGIFPEERVTPQPVTVDLRLDLDLDRCARSGDLNATIDYARLARDVEKILCDGRFRLLETAGLAVLSYALAPRIGMGQPESAKIILGKPRALGGKARAFVTLQRTAPDVAPKGDCLFTCDDVEIRLRGDDIIVSSRPG